MILARPAPIPESVLRRVRDIEGRLESHAVRGNLQSAKRALNELKPVLKQYNHNARLYAAYLRLYEAALESWTLGTAERGFNFVRDNANKGTRLRLEATALIAITHLRKGNAEAADPFIKEVLLDEETITSPDKRREFRREVIDRFDEEGALAALAKVHVEVLDEPSAKERAIELLREGKNEEEIADYIGVNMPNSVKAFLYKVDEISKNALPNDERLLLPSPGEMVKDKKVGEVVFAGVKRRLYRRVCDKDSDVYQAWLSGGMDALTNINNLPSVVLAALTDLRLGAGAIAVGVIAMTMKMGINTFCEKSKPRRLMSFRR